ncbi:hypothetical protein L933_02255 [Helicobacter pylori PZ5056]|uniref:Uncharacterized protein n=1 Tax=Helicobacter pylori PZ5056 TaxID=1337393 RepID=T2SXW5_HELPX|nr:hypothetical protein L933_02255 [Helicobacter pylori PZ5056]
MKIKVGGGLVLALCPYNRDFIGFECLKARLIPHALEKFSCWIVGVKSVSLLGLNIL